MSVRAGARVAARAMLAAFGGYALAAAATACLSLALPMARADAVTTATLLSFAVFAAAVIWTFAARRLGAALLGLAIPTLAWLLRGGAGG